MHREEALDFSGVITFNLDEYLGISPEHPQSFHHFMTEHFFLYVNLKPRNIHIPDGTISGDYEKYCAAYEAEIQNAGGIDLQILGIGRNGHIGFTEQSHCGGQPEIFWGWGDCTAGRDHYGYRHDTGLPACAYAGHWRGESCGCCKRDRGAYHSVGDGFGAATTSRRYRHRG
jgi:hypothetical protein